MQALANGRGLVLDLEFGDLMSQKEHKSLMSQLMYCYSTNTRASTPCKMILTGISGDTKSLYDAIPGTSNWYRSCSLRRFERLLVFFPPDFLGTVLFLLSTRAELA